MLAMSKKFPPGYLQPNDWPRLSGFSHKDDTFDPPVYQIPPVFKDHLLSYFEEEIYFTYRNDYIMPKEAEDGVVKVSATGNTSYWMFRDYEKNPIPISVF